MTKKNHFTAEIVSFIIIFIITFIGFLLSLIVSLQGTGKLAAFLGAAGGREMDVYLIYYLIT